MLLAELRQRGPHVAGGRQDQHKGGNQVEKGAAWHRSCARGVGEGSGRTR